MTNFLAGLSFPSEIILRSIAVYLFILIAIRIFGKKEFSQLTIIDLVFILLLSNSVQNAMVGTDSSLAGGIVAAASLFFVNFLYFSISLNPFSVTMP